MPYRIVGEFQLMEDFIFVENVPIFGMFHGHQHQRERVVGWWGRRGEWISMKVLNESSSSLSSWWEGKEHEKSETLWPSIHFIWSVIALMKKIISQAEEQENSVDLCKNIPNIYGIPNNQTCYSISILRVFVCFRGERESGIWIFSNLACEMKASCCRTWSRTLNITHKTQHTATTKVE